MQSSDRLTVYLSSIAQKVLFDNDKRAIGVLINQPADVPSYKLTARKEVIVSAGAVSFMSLPAITRSTADCRTDALTTAADAFWSRAKGDASRP